MVVAPEAAPVLPARKSQLRPVPRSRLDALTERGEWLTEHESGARGGIPVGNGEHPPTDWNMIGESGRFTAQ
jgi:hypothetical protein